MTQRDRDNKVIKPGALVRIEGHVELSPDTGAEIMVRIHEGLSVWVLSKAVNILEEQT